MRGKNKFCLEVVILQVNRNMFTPAKIRGGGYFVNNPMENQKLRV